MKYKKAGLEIGKFDFPKQILNMDISLKNPQTGLKSRLCVFHNHMEGMLSQIVHLGFSFCFM